MSVASNRASDVKSTLQRGLCRRSSFPSDFRWGGRWRPGRGTGAGQSAPPVGRPPICSCHRALELNCLNMGLLHDEREVLAVLAVPHLLFRCLKLLGQLLYLSLRCLKRILVYLGYVFLVFSFFVLLFFLFKFCRFWSLFWFF